MRAGILGCTCAAVVAALLLGNSAFSPAARRPGRSRDIALTASQKLGPLAAGTRLRLVLALSDPHAVALDRLIASGHAVTPATFAKRFLPPVIAVRSAVRTLDAEGLEATWSPGSPALDVTGSAAAVDRAFDVQLDRYRASGGRVFYAAAAAPRLSGPLHDLVSTVAGLNDNGRLKNLSGGGSGSSGSGCGQTIGGYTPSQILSAYNFDPLFHGGLTGAGQTVVFIEINTFAQSDLRCFAKQFGERSFDVTARSGNFGTADNSNHDEADLDLEIVHSIAPAAHLVVYESDATSSDIAAAAQAAVSAYPKAILSVSVGGCEWERVDKQGNPRIASDQRVWDTALKQLAATGGSAFIASGDSGAYTCGSDVTDSSGAEAPTVSFPASDPYATSVGGTTLFLGADSSYAGEAVWGSPFEATGSGGGLSSLWKRPAWQKGPGVTNQYTDGYRQLPDVSALGDPNTGWNIYDNGSWDIIAGTSAAAPLWAGLIALADQSLAKNGLPSVGFANLPLYSFGQHPKQPAQAFHQVTRGTNLYYPATAGWNDATGFGSPDGAGLVDDLIAYRRVHK